jgi:CubicO group peptidase (beta-lactamase class C family)
MTRRSKVQILRRDLKRPASKGLFCVRSGRFADGEVATACTGVADSEQVTPETRFAVGSLAKSMVATAVARLVAAGRLSLDDPVVAHVPELRGAGWAARASLRDLPANRSRIPLRAEFEFSAFPGDDDRVLSRFAENVAAGEPTPPFDGRPGVLYDMLWGLPRV